MITVLACVICLTVSHSNLRAQRNNQRLQLLLPVQVNSKWGYINAKGRVVIKPRFIVARNFSEGLAAVRNDAGWFYYIDVSGRVITGRDRYRFADDFSGGLAAVQKGVNDKIGFIDITGHWAIKPTFDRYTGKIIGSFKMGSRLFNSTNALGLLTPPASL